MNREQTQQLKGIAILFMIWGHLFGDSFHVMIAYHPLLMLGDLPLVTIVSRATGPVSFFLFLSGYGLYCANQKEDKHRYTRILKLLLTYWVSLLCVVLIGIFVKPDHFDFSLSVVWGNIIGLNPTYIPEAWFMLPYLLLALTAPLEFLLLKSVKARFFLPISFLLVLLTSFLLSRYGSSYIYKHRLFYVFFCWFHFQFPFLLGMASARRGGPIQLIRSVMNTHTHWGYSVCCRYLPLLLIFLIAVRCITSSSAPHSMFVFLFISIWVNLRIPDWMNKILIELGNRSTGMWFVHTPIGIYLFPDWTNLLQNPFFVFLIITLLSWLVSIFVGFICKELTNATSLIYHRLS